MQLQYSLGGRELSVVVSSSPPPLLQDAMHAPFGITTLVLKVGWGVGCDSNPSSLDLNSTKSILRVYWLWQCLFSRLSKEAKCWALQFSECNT